MIAKKREKNIYNNFLLKTNKGCNKTIANFKSEDRINKDLLFQVKYIYIQFNFIIYSIIIDSIFIQDNQQKKNNNFIAKFN